MQRKIYFRQLLYYALLITVFSIPFYREITSLLIWILLFIWIFTKDKKNIIKSNITSVYHRNVFVLSILLFVSLLLSLIYTENIKNGIFQLEIKLSFLAFPIVFTSLKRFDSKRKNAIFLYFIIANTLAALICLVYATYLTIETTNNSNYNFIEGFWVYSTQYFTYNNLSLFHHPAYFASYLIFTIGLILYVLKKKSFDGNRFIKPFLILSLITSLTTIYLLASRAGYLSLLIIAVIGAYAFIKEKQWLLALSFFAIFFILFSTFVKFSPRQQVIKIATESILTKDNAPNTNKDQRLMIWESAVEVIKQNPILGVGIGDAKEALLNVFENNGYTHLHEKKLNAHNEFLDIYIAGGMLALILLLLMFIIPAIRSLSLNQFILLLFLMVLGLNLFFESMLSKQSGVVFFSLFYNFLIFHFYAKE